MKLSIKYFCLVLSLLLVNCAKIIEGDLIITNVNIIDVKTGNIELAKDIVITDDKITNIEKHKSSTNYQAETVINGSEKFMIPGLWDMHTHTWANYKDYFPLLLANGVTGVREMFGDMETIKRIREQINKGDIYGPMIYSSGLIIDGNPPDHNGSDIVETPEQGREIVRQQIADGAEFIKVYSNLKREVYYAIADECKKQGIALNGHIPVEISLKEAIESGHQGAEHFHGILEYAAGLFEPKTLDSLNATDFNIYDYTERVNYVLDNLNDKNTQETIELLSNNNAWVCPTLMVFKGSEKYMDPTTPLDDRLNYMPDNAINTWGLEPWEANDESRMYLNLYKRRYKEITSLIQTLNQNKVRFLAGTDYANPHTYPGFSLHDELEAFVKDCGFTPLEVLQTATINPAIFMKKETELGTVEMNKLANLVLLNKNPLVDISNTKAIEAVIVSGQYLEGIKLRDDLEVIAIENRKPKIKDVLSKLIEEQGIETAINEYHKLKKSQPDTYNFTVGQLNGLGYQLLRRKKITEAVAIFKLNTKMFPDDANAYDSLGDAYTEAKDTINAIKAYETAVSKGFNVSKPKIEALKEKAN